MCIYKIKKYEEYRKIIFNSNIYTIYIYRYILEYNYY